MKYRLSDPVITAKTHEYVNDVLKSGWLSIEGKYVRLFEEHMRNIAELPYGMAVCSGTAALQVALTALELPKGARVAVPNYGCAAIIQAINFAGYEPVLIDVELNTYGMDYSLFVQATEMVQLDALILVHLFGVANQDTVELYAHAGRLGIPVIADCAEAHGTRFHVKLDDGGFESLNVSEACTIACYSCRSEKIVGACESGFIASKNEALIVRCNELANRGRPVTATDLWDRFKYDIPGSGNFMLNNLVAAVGAASAENYVFNRQGFNANALYYRDDNRLDTLGNWQHLIGEPVVWLNVFCFNPDIVTHAQVREIGHKMISKGAEVRPGFYPFDKLRLTTCTTKVLNGASHKLWQQSFRMPSAPNLTRQDIIECLGLLHESINEVLK